MFDVLHYIRQNYQLHNISFTCKDLYERKYNISLRCSNIFCSEFLAKNLDELYLSYFKDQYSFLSRLSNLRKLRCFYFRFNDEFNSSSAIFKNLQILSAIDITQEELNCLNLIELNILFCYNKIVNLNHMSNLQILTTNTSMEVEAFKKLKLKKLTSISKNIININMPSLEILSSDYINQESIYKLTNLKELYCTLNTNIINLNHMTRLEILHSDYILQKGISKLTGLKHFNCRNNTNIINLNHMTRLETLISDHVLQEGISELTKLKYFDCRNNTNIINLNHMTRLEKLIANHISQESISELTKLKYFYCRNNTNIINLNHMTRLEKLTSNYVSQEGINEITSLKHFNCRNNTNIVNLNHMTRLEKLIANHIPQKGIDKLTSLKYFDYTIMSKLLI